VTVREQTSGTNYGSATILEIGGAAGKRARTFLRVAVTGIGTQAVTAAHLHLQVASLLAAASPSGGRIHAVADCSWSEATLTWGTQPVIDGGVLSTVGNVTRSQAVDFDVTGAITRGDGVYCFAIESPYNNPVTYNSRESAGQRPQLSVTVAP